jgi:F-type H+-transporting ATPase subunit b
MLNAEWGLIPWTLLTFGLSVFVLWKFAFGPLQRAIDERRARIQESMDAAEETRLEAQRLLDEYKQTLAEVRGEAEGILERSRAAADATKAEALAVSRAQAERVVVRAHAQIERETRAALQELKAQVAELTLLATEKVAASSLSEADQRRLIDEALADIDFDQLKTEQGG